MQYHVINDNASLFPDKSESRELIKLEPINRKQRVENNEKGRNVSQEFA